MNAKAKKKGFTIRNTTSSLRQRKGRAPRTVTSRDNCMILSHDMTEGGGQLVGGGGEGVLHHDNDTDVTP